MSVAAHGTPPADLPEESPRAIRAALPPADVADFDREYRRVMGEATDTLDLTAVATFLRRWRRIAWGARDHAAHQNVLDRAAALARGETVATEPWSETRTALGL